MGWGQARGQACWDGVRIGDRLMWDDVRLQGQACVGQCQAGGPGRSQAVCAAESPRSFSTLHLATRMAFFFFNKK